LLYRRNAVLMASCFTIVERLLQMLRYILPVSCNCNAPKYFRNAKCRCRDKYNLSSRMFRSSNNEFVVGRVASVAKCAIVISVTELHNFGCAQKFTYISYLF